MKLGSPPPPPPDDEAADPLLAALRQRLGDYGQAPPPGAWAAIRQQIRPVALPRPWWRRPGRLLPVLGLLLGWLLPGILGEPLQKTGLSNWIAGNNLSTSNKLSTQPQAHRPAAIATSGELATPERSQSVTSVTARQPLAPQPLMGSAGASHGIALHFQAKHKGNQHSSAGANKGIAHKEATASATRADALALATKATARRRGRRTTPSTTELSAVAPPAFAAATAHARHRSGWLAAADNNHRGSIRKRATSPSSLNNNTDNQNIEAGNPSTIVVAAAAIPSRRRAKKRASTSQLVASSASTAHAEAYHSTPASRRAPKDQSSSRIGLAARTKARQSGSSLPVPSATQEVAYSPVGTTTPGTARPRAGHAYSSLSLLEPVDSLALKQTSLLLLASARPAVLAARPDSTISPVHPMRRWSLLLVAGPTLSYRTLGPAPTLAAGHPDFARLERPALGLGAQVQVRRVLSGRWALAVGVGYHEYATRLALVLKDSVSVHQRDTYRLLTVPVQFTYALGVPRGRLAVGLLLGTELGWYIGGRSTEGSDCGCKQQVYPADSARTSPYRSLSLALSLGLDLRYRLGGPASRWQLLVQPTGRYVATPFVRSDAVGFTRRQPWSLGLMTGFSWDVR